MTDHRRGGGFSRRSFIKAGAAGAATIAAGAAVPGSGPGSGRIAGRRNRCLKVQSKDERLTGTRRYHARSGEGQLLAPVTEPPAPFVHVPLLSTLT